MIDARQATADRLSAQAKLHSVRGEHDDAVRQQRAAIALHREIYEERLHGSEQDTSVEDAELHEAAQRLADHYGRLGGMYRRAEQLEAALDSYTRGSELERDWRLNDSYNRTNKIAIALLIDPAQLPELADEIKQAAQMIRGQVDRTRRDQWWAWADLGLLSLLDGRQRDAQWAYQQFEASGARRGDYEKTLAVLRKLHTSLATVQPALATTIARVIENLS